MNGSQTTTGRAVRPRWHILACLAAFILLGLARGGFADMQYTSQEADYDRMSRAELQQHLTLLYRQIAEESSRTQDYLSHYDQVLNLGVVNGQFSRGEAEQQLKEKGADLFSTSFTAANYSQLLQQHQSAAQGYFDRVERALRTSSIWPDQALTQEYQSLALSQLGELRAEYAQRMQQGLDPLVILIDAAELNSWASGSRDLPASQNPFAGTFQRVLYAIPNAEIRQQLLQAGGERRRGAVAPRPKPVPLAKRIEELAAGVDVPQAVTTSPQSPATTASIPQQSIPVPAYTTIDHPNGDRYEGQVLNNLMHGRGTYHWATGSAAAWAGDRYEGEWYNNLMSGQGTYYFHNGARYEGSWMDNKKSGHGTMIYADGSRFDGEWANDLINGYGTMSYIDGNRYEGSWANNMFNGQGTMHYNDNSQYSGAWFNNSKHGKGTSTNARGDRYDGDWESDTMHGRGTLVYVEGGRYVGEFDHNRPVGGWFHWPTGERAWSYQDAGGNWVMNEAPPGG